MIGRKLTGGKERHSGWDSPGWRARFNPPSRAAIGTHADGSDANWFIVVTGNVERSVSDDNYPKIKLVSEVRSFRFFSSPGSKTGVPSTPTYYKTRKVAGPRI